MFAIRPKVFNNDDETVRSILSSRVFNFYYTVRKAEFIKLAGEK